MWSWSAEFQEATAQRVRRQPAMQQQAHNDANEETADRCVSDSTWERLPYDLASQVFAILATPHTLKQLRTVCRRWKRQVDCSVLKLSVELLPDTHWFPQRFSHLQMLDLCKCCNWFDTDLSRFLFSLSTMKTLRSLTLGIWCTVRLLPNSYADEWHLFVPDEVGLLERLTSFKILPVEGLQDPDCEHQYFSSQLSCLQRLEELVTHIVVPPPTALVHLCRLRRLVVTACSPIHHDALPDIPCLSLTAVEYQGSASRPDPEVVSLPTTLSLLINPTNLTRLALAFARLKFVPDWVSELGNLRVLDLSHNELVGSSVLPVFTLTSLLDLDLAYNSLGAVADAFSCLTSLQALNLAYNNMTELPPSLSSLSELQRLTARHNSLSNIPEGCCGLLNLCDADFSMNKITAVPHDFWQLPQLRRIHLSRNRIVSISPSISSASALIDLDLAANHLNTLPREVGTLSNLRSLAAGLNYMKSVPIGLRGLAQLTCLDVQHLLYCLPDPFAFLRGISVLRNLVELDVSSNNIVKLPVDWSCLGELKVLHLAHNLLDTLPEPLLSMSSLTWLDLSYNRLRDLPPGVSRLAGLRHLVLAKNHLQLVPAELASLAALSCLDLYQNALGCLPDSLARLRRLQRLNLGRNYKLRALPPGLAASPALRNACLPATLADSLALALLRARHAAVSFE